VPWFQEACAFEHQILVKLVYNYYKFMQYIQLSEYFQAMIAINAHVFWLSIIQNKLVRT
jgi:hypothetical protein